MVATVPITLSGPAKVYGRIEPAGKTLEVSVEIAAELEAVGVVAAPADVATAQMGGAVSDFRIMSDTQFDAAVQAEARKLAGQAFDGALDQLEAEAKALAGQIDTITAERDAALSRAIEAEAQRDLLQERVLELQDVLLTQTDEPPEAPPTVQADTPPTEQAAQTAPKKGAAAKSKG